VAKETIKQGEGTWKHKDTLVLRPTGDNNNTSQAVKFIPFQQPAIHRRLRDTNKTHTYIE